MPRMSLLAVRLLIVVLTTAAGTVAHAQTTPPPARAGAQPAAPAADAGDRLPVRRVVLYKSGVGYFEHVGRVRDSQTVSITLTSGQLDDVLKSLTTVDLGDGRVTGITFNSSAPLEQRLRTLNLPLGPTTTRWELLQAVRGARVEVQGTGATTTGRVLSLEQRQRATSDGLVAIDELTIVTDNGAVRSFELRPGVGVRLVDGELRGELTQYLDLLASTRAQDVRRLSLATDGTGLRDLFVSYISEVPVWKTTYRLVVPADGTGKPFLQGWAIVDNTLGENWTDVQLSLVAGAPQSFVQRVSQPLYTRRPVIPLPTAALHTPQTHGATMTGGSDADDGQRGQHAEAVTVEGDSVAKAMADRQAANARFSASPPRGGFGAVASAAPPPPAPAPAAEAVEARLRESQAAASAADLGDLFEYKLTQPVTILRNQSALVPIVQADIGVERVSLWNATNPGARPLRALWLTNDTRLTLDGGSLTLIEGGAFAGEGLLEAIKPGEKRFVSYAADLAGRVTAATEGGPRRISRVRIASGVMTQFHEERSTTVYTVRNEDGESRDFIIEHPVKDGWQFRTDSVTPVESTATAHRFRTSVAPNATATLRVEEVRPIESRIQMSNLNTGHIAVILRGRNLPADVEPQLRAIVAKTQEVARLRTEAAERTAEVERIGEDQARIRENLSALKGSREERALVARYTGQLTAQEDRLDVLRGEVEALAAQTAAANAELARMAGSLSLDVEL